MTDLELELKELVRQARGVIDSADALRRMDPVGVDRLLVRLHAQVWKQKIISLNVTERIQHILPPGLTELSPKAFDIQGTWEFFNTELLKISIPEDIPKVKAVSNSGIWQWWYDIVRNTVRAAVGNSGRIPYFDRAFVLVDIHSPFPTASPGGWDTSNRACNLIFNGMKGLLFRDDSVRYLSYGVTGKADPVRKTDVYICPAEHAGRVLDQVRNEGF
jgi:hypothetical protein